MNLEERCLQMGKAVRANDRVAVERLMGRHTTDKEWREFRAISDGFMRYGD